MQAYEDYTHSPTLLSISTTGTESTSMATTGTDTQCPRNPDRDLNQIVSTTYFFGDRWKSLFSMNIYFYNYNFFPDSPYGDVSGLPDPYTGHDISDELLRQTGAMNGITGISHDTADMGAMAQHHEGYTNILSPVIQAQILTIPTVSRHDVPYVFGGHDLPYGFGQMLHHLPKLFRKSTTPSWST